MFTDQTVSSFQKDVFGSTVHVETCGLLHHNKTMSLGAAGTSRAKSTKKTSFILKKFLIQGNQHPVHKNMYLCFVTTGTDVDDCCTEWILKEINL